MARARWRILTSVATDVRPLRVSAPFRRLWVGNSVAQLGQQMTAVTIAIQVYAITGSSFAVGTTRSASSSSGEIATAAIA